MTRRIIKQFEVAGQELGTFITLTEPIRRYTWRIYFLRREESEVAVDIIKRAIDEAADPDRMPVKVNWKDKLGSVVIDDSDQEIFMLDFEDFDGQRLLTSAEGRRVGQQG